MAQPANLREVVNICRMGSGFYVYRGQRLIRVCPSIGMAREVAAGARAA